MATPRDPGSGPRRAPDGDARRLEHAVRLDTRADGASTPSPRLAPARWDEALDAWLLDLKDCQVTLGARLLEAHAGGQATGRVLDGLKQAKGELTALAGRLVSLFHYPVRDRCRSLTVWRGDRADDLVARVERILCADLALRFFPVRKALIGWVFQVTDRSLRYELRTLARQQRLEQPLPAGELPDAAAGVEDLIAQSEIARDIRRVLTRIEPHRCLILLVHYGFSLNPRHEYRLEPLSAQALAARFNEDGASAALVRLLPEGRQVDCLDRVRSGRTWTAKKVYDETYAAMMELRALVMAGRHPGLQP